METASKVGNYHKNPFNLRRKWIVKTAETDALERPFSEREKYLEQRLAQIEEQFKAFQEQLKITSEAETPKTRG